MMIMIRDENEIREEEMEVEEGMRGNQWMD